MKLFCNFSSEEIGFEQTRKLRKVAENYKEILHVWAAGNDGKDARNQNGSLHLDTNKNLNKLDNIIVVGAITKDKHLAYYSNYGDTVDIVAPTEFKSIKGTKEYVTTNPMDYGKGDRYAFSGTSSSAPVVTGVASLIFSLNPKFSASDVKSILINSATDYVVERDNYLFDEKKLIVSKLSSPIPILNAETALKLAQNILDAKVSKISYDIANPFFPTIDIGFKVQDKFDFKSMTLEVNKSFTGTVWDKKDHFMPGVSSSILHESKYRKYKINGSAKLENKKTGIIFESDIEQSEFTISELLISVKDKKTLESLDHNVEVTIEKIYGNQTLESYPKGFLSDEGTVKLYFVKNDAYKIHIKANGYKDFSTKFTPNQSVLSIYLEATDSNLNVGSLHGQISDDATSEYIGNAIVEVFENGKEETVLATALTDSYGNYQLFNIPKINSNSEQIASYTLKVKAYDYLDKYINNVLILDASHGQTKNIKLFHIQDFFANAGEDQTVKEKESVTLDASKSTAKNNSKIVSYLWKEGDTVLSESYSFSKNDFALGKHIVTLKITDDKGNIAIDTVSIVVIPKDLEATEAIKKGGFEISTNGSNVVIDTSRSLNYGLLNREDFNTASTEALFGKTKMLQRQEEFFNIKNAINPFKDGMTSRTEFSYDALAYTDNTQREYVLYTEFDRFSKPALMNYGTLFSIGLDVLSSGTGKKLFKGLSKKIDTTIKSVDTARKSINEWNNVVRDKLEVIDIIATLVDNREVAK